MKSALLFPFVNRAEGRLRAGWRILISLILYGLLLTALQWPLFSSLSSNLNTPALLFIEPATTIAASLLMLWLAARWIARRPLADYGLHLNARWWLDLLFGLVLGAVLMALIFLVEAAAGWVTITATLYQGGSTPLALVIAYGLWLFIAVGISEELISRGILLREMAEGFNLGRIGSRGALLLAYLLSSIFFGLLHAFNPNADWVSTVLLVAAGLFLGLGFVLTGELAIPIGLHISWNFFQGRVFGFPVSGTTPGSSLIAIQQGGPTLWTGGNFGPEAGLIGLLAILLGCALIVWWVSARRAHLQLAVHLAEHQPQNANNLAVNRSVQPVAPPDDF